MDFYFFSEERYLLPREMEQQVSRRPKCCIAQLLQEASFLCRHTLAEVDLPKAFPPSFPTPPEVEEDTQCQELRKHQLLVNGT